jgi:hypothetical protein
MVPSILFSWVMLSIIVGVAAVTRGHNAAWFLFALIISPLLAALCLIALRHRRSRSRPSNVVVVFCGRSAQRVVGQVLLPSHVRTLKTFHTGTKSYRRLRCRADIHAKFEEAAWLVKG